MCFFFGIVGDYEGVYVDVYFVVVLCGFGLDVIDLCFEVFDCIVVGEVLV